MAHDGFLGAFPHELPWQLAHAAAGAPLDSLHVQAPHPLVASGWDGHDAAMSSSPVLAAHEAALMEQLVVTSRLGAPSPPSSLYASKPDFAERAARLSCYSSPSKPDFAERAARLSCFAAASGGNNLSRVASSQSLLAEPAASPRGVNASDGSSSDGPSRKRKAVAAAGGKNSNKAKDTAVTTATAKKSPEADRRSKKSKLSMDSSGEDDEPSMPATGNAGKGKEMVVAEPPKDYIHVRARRGQATDSHSLAERVRREKISERMKLLQDIVPGCSKVTGKAVMLDEIINYVQSLQRQVEFLSMKLSTVNPRLDVDVDSFVQKDADQSCAPAPTSLPPPVYSMEGSNSPFGYASSPAPAVPGAVASAKSFERTSSFVSHGNMPDHSIQGFQNTIPPQIERPWEDDLQSLVQMGFRGNT